VRTILALTANVPVAESPLEPVAVTMYPTPYVHPAPTLKLADSSPLLPTVQEGVSIINPAWALSVHPSETLKPVPKPSPRSPVNHPRGVSRL
jgi:hypothetical protein